MNVSCKRRNVGLVSLVMEIPMPKNSYAEKINATKLMLNGLGEHQSTLSKRGIDQAFITEYSTLQQQAQNLDNEQESLKAKLKQKTDELDKAIEQMEKKYSEAKKLVKMDIPATAWKAFGIADSR